MEERVKLTTTTSFNVDEEELKRFYTIMALLQYHHHREPDYDQQKMIRRLNNDFNRFNREIKKAKDKDPNNLALSQICNFIQHHQGYLRRMINN